MIIFGIIKVFTSNFTDERKLEVNSRKKNAIHFFMQLLEFPQKLVKIQFIFISFSRKIQKFYKKMKGILLPRNYFKFPFVQVIVSKIACKSLYNTKNEHFLTAYHQKVVRENFFRGFGDILSIKNTFKPIRIINRSHSQLIWTCTGEKRNH